MPPDGPEGPASTLRPRYRYILFRVERPRGLSRNEFVAALRRATDGRAVEAWLTRFDGAHGVLRCRRGEEAEGILALREGLPRAGIDVTTLSTSGTIAALERRHGVVPRGERRR